MAVFFDSTESRQGTRLPQSVLDAGKPVEGLEAFTGADILLSTIAKPPLTKITAALPHQLALKKHVAAGTLIQRKTGRDLVNSLRGGHLTQEVLYRMQQWVPNPVLLFIGSLGCNRKGYAVVDGQDTDYTHQQVQGALWAWQLRGGMLVMLPHDGTVGPWFAWFYDQLASWHKAKLIGARKPIQALISDERYPWRRTLETLPNIATEKSAAVADYCGTLWESLAFLSDPVGSILLKRIQDPETGKLVANPAFPKDIGLKTLMQAHDYLGLGPGEKLCIIKDENELPAIGTRKEAGEPCEKEAVAVPTQETLPMAMPQARERGVVVNADGEIEPLPF